VVPLCCPCRFVSFNSYFQGLATQLETLNVQLAWWPLLKQAITPQIIEESMLWQFGDNPVKAAPVYKGSAKELHVHIARQDKDPIHIRLPAENALQLENLMPEHIHEHIRDAHIDLPAMREKLIQEGLEPQTLIDIKRSRHTTTTYI